MYAMLKGLQCIIGRFRTGSHFEVYTSCENAIYASKYLVYLVLDVKQHLMSPNNLLVLCLLDVLYLLDLLQVLCLPEVLCLH